MGKRKTSDLSVVEITNLKKYKQVKLGKELRKVDVCYHISLCHPKLGTRIKIHDDMDNRFKNQIIYWIKKGRIWTLKKGTQ